MKTITKFGTWSLRTMTEPGKLEMVCAEFDRLNIDILGRDGILEADGIEMGK